MTYTLTAHPNTIVRDEDGAFIPTDPDNIDYQAYLAWLDEGNEPTPYTPPEVQGEDTNGDPPEPVHEPAHKATVIKSGGSPAPSRRPKT